MVPAVTIFVAYVGTAVGLGTVTGIAVLVSDTSFLGAVATFVAITLLALLSGVFAVRAALSVVAPGVALGVIGGYLLARGVLRSTGDRSADGG